MKENRNKLRIAKKLEKLALDRLQASANSEERWSFVFHTEESISFQFIPSAIAEKWVFDQQFDAGREGVLLSWLLERRNSLQRGEASPTLEEEREWREAKRRYEAGTEQCWIAWITPLWIEKNIAGYALFVCSSYGDPDDAPELAGVFDTIAEAEATLGPHL